MFHMNKHLKLFDGTVGFSSNINPKLRAQLASSSSQLAAMFRGLKEAAVLIPGVEVEALPSDVNVRFSETAQRQC